MSIIEITTSNRKKCGSCKFFIPNKSDWFCGKCVSETTRVKDRERFYTSNMCASKEMKNENN